MIHDNGQRHSRGKEGLTDRSTYLHHPGSHEEDNNLMIGVLSGFHQRRREARHKVRHGHHRVPARKRTWCLGIIIISGEDTHPVGSDGPDAQRDFRAKDTTGYAHVSNVDHRDGLTKETLASESIDQQ